MDVQGRIDRHWNLQFKSASGDDFYYESGIGSVTVPAGDEEPVCRILTEPRWERLRSVVPFVAVELYSGAGMLRDAFIKTFGWARDEENRVALRFVLPMLEEPEYAGNFTYTLAVLGELIPPYMVPIGDVL
jgi:hypothetical protein